LILTETRHDPQNRAARTAKKVQSTPTMVRNGAILSVDYLYNINNFECYIQACFFGTITNKLLRSNVRYIHKSRIARANLYLLQCGLLEALKKCSALAVGPVDDGWQECQEPIIKMQTW
jgi:hypothetical protein